MKPIARRTLTVLALVLTVSLLSGCIVRIEDIWCDDHVRRATLHVYVRDYYSGAPIDWARVKLYERDWWSWDHVGTWRVNDYGYVVVRDGYLSCDGCGGPEEEDFLVVVTASGYYSEEYEIELSYYYPSETLTFYLVPWYGRDGGEAREDGGLQTGRVDVGEVGGGDD
jgi:hypothetical protein